MAVALLALAIRAVLDGGVTQSALAFSGTFGLVYALISMAFVHAARRPTDRTGE